MGDQPIARRHNVFGIDHCTPGPALIEPGGMRQQMLEGDRLRVEGDDEDFAATLYTKMGIDPAQHLHANTGRPVQLVNGGQPIRELFA